MVSDGQARWGFLSQEMRIIRIFIPLTRLIDAEVIGVQSTQELSVLGPRQRGLVQLGQEAVQLVRAVDPPLQASAGELSQHEHF